MTTATTPSSARADLPTWLRVGVLSFGGPAGQIALMHRLLVEELRWIDERGFMAGLNFCMLLPGPEAQQLATWIGWRRAGWRGALVAGGLFVLPGMLCMLLLSAAYVTFGELRPVSAAFLGVKCAVLSIVLEALLRIGRRALRFGGAAWIAAAAFVAIYILRVPFPLIVGGAAVLGYLLRASPGVEHAPSGHALPGHLRLVAAALLAWLVPLAVVLLLTGAGSMYSRIGLFYSVVAIVTFGGAYAVLGYVADRAVGDWGWLDARQMADGLGLAETTPGPLILVLQFVAFVAMFQATQSAHPYALAAAAAVLGSWVLFVPSFVWIFLGGPYVERINADERLRGALSFVTAAVVGVVLNLAVWFAMHVVFARVERVAIGPLAIDLPVAASFDARVLGLVALSAALMFGLKQGIGRTLLLSALAGLALDYAMGRVS